MLQTTEEFCLCSGFICVLCLLGLYHFRVVIMVDSISYLAKQNPVILQSLESPEQ